MRERRAGSSSWSTTSSAASPRATFAPSVRGTPSSRRRSCTRPSCASRPGGRSATRAARTSSRSPLALLTDEQIARDPGYSSPPGIQTYAFGARGSQRFPGAHLFDVDLRHDLLLGRGLRAFVELEAVNVFNSRKQIAWDLTVIPDEKGPRDELGLPTQYIRAPTFGQATRSEHYVEPRAVRFALGMRF